MNVIANLPMLLRATALLVLGIVIGGQVNRGIYRLAWDKRSIGPWSRPHADAPPRRWYDRIPLFGWLTLRRESFIHGAAFWVRPLAIELSCGIGFATLYWWETAGQLVPPAPGLGPTDIADLHAQCLSHLILISLMVVATFIDIDEQLIPDEITVPGTLAGLSLAAMLPASLLPVPVRAIPAGNAVGNLVLTSPLRWPPWLNDTDGLAIGLACFGFWCFAILPKTWWTRDGLARAFRFLTASMIRYSSRWHRIGLPLVACVIVGVWLWCGDRQWHALLSSLIGVAFGSGLVWLVRVVGTAALGREAMGFGDVTLMAMIGSFVGWQASMMTFFLAPFTGVVIAVVQWLLTRRKDIAFGPFLCMAALVVMVCWARLWGDWGGIFELGWYIPAIVCVCIILMGGMLLAWRAFSAWVSGPARHASD